jgi:hypothetical protein
VGNLFLEVQILSAEVVSRKNSEFTTDGPSAEVFSIRVLDEQEGVFTVFHGKHWHIVSIKDLLNWRREDLKPKVGLENYSIKGSEEQSN